MPASGCDCARACGHMCVTGLTLRLTLLLHRTCVRGLIRTCWCRCYFHHTIEVHTSMIEQPYGFHPFIRISSGGGLDLDLVHWTVVTLQGWIRVSNVESDWSPEHGGKCIHYCGRAPHTLPPQVLYFLLIGFLVSQLCLVLIRILINLQLVERGLRMKSNSFLQACNEK